MRWTPAPPSLPEIAMRDGRGWCTSRRSRRPCCTVTELVGAAESDWAVKLVPVLESPALFCAVTLPDCVAAVLLKV